MMGDSLRKLHSLAKLHMLYFAERESMRSIAEKSFSWVVSIPHMSPFSTFSFSFVFPLRWLVVISILRL